MTTAADNLSKAEAVRLLTVYFLAMQLIEEEMKVGSESSDTGEKGWTEAPPIRFGLIMIK